MTVRARTTSEDVFERSKARLVGGVNSPVRAFGAVGGTPRVMEKGKGAYLTDVDGVTYLDFTMSWGPLILGHAHPAVLKAVGETMARGTSFGTPSREELALAERVIEAMPSIEKVRFVSSGTEATMTALRLARGVTGRSYILKFSGCYHGHSDALLVAAGSGLATSGIASSAGVPAEFAARTLVAPYNDTRAFRDIMAKYGDEVAAVIVEPVAGNMGVVVPDDQFLVELRAETTRRGALLIYDEVITGFRLGWGGRQGVLSSKPDITCLGKIIGGGFPVGALGGRAEIMDHLAPLGNVYQGGTLSGNPVAMAAGRATLEWLKKEDPYARLGEMTSAVVAGLREAAKASGVPVMINHIGSMFTVFFTSGPVHRFSDAQRADTKAYGQFFHALLEAGVYFPPSQFEACFLSTAHDAKDIKKAARAFARAFAAVGA